MNRSHSYIGHTPMSPTTERALSALLLALGGSIYLLFRPQELLMFRVAQRMGLSSAIDAIQSAASGLRLPHFIVDSLPGGLWATAYVLLVDSLPTAMTPTQRLAAASIIPLIGTASEVMQGLGMLPGTFDPLDLLCYLAPIAWMFEGGGRRG